MNKTELVAAAAKKADLSLKDTDKALAAIVDVITCAAPNLQEMTQDSANPGNDSTGSPTKRSGRS